MLRKTSHCGEGNWTFMRGICHDAPSSADTNFELLCTCKEYCSDWLYLLLFSRNILYRNISIRGTLLTEGPLALDQALIVERWHLGLDKPADPQLTHGDRTLGRDCRHRCVTHKLVCQDLSANAPQSLQAVAELKSNLIMTESLHSDIQKWQRAFIQTYKSDIDGPME